MGLGEHTACVATMGLLRAVDHLHRNNIVHRDIKPKNILVKNIARSKHDANSSTLLLDVKLTDFGLSKSKSQGKTAMQTVAGDAGGTGVYLAPEAGMHDDAEVHKAVSTSVTNY